MKKIALSVMLLMQFPISAAQAGIEGTYGIHLYFDEKEFVDVLTVEKLNEGMFSGMMHVPNDFDGTIEAIHVDGQKLAFDLPVPKNAARPKDLVFRYSATFFDASFRQLVGFVTLANEPGFIASFVGFRRNEMP